MMMIKNLQGVSLNIFKRVHTTGKGTYTTNHATKGITKTRITPLFGARFN